MFTIGAKKVFELYSPFVIQEPYDSIKYKFQKCRKILRAYNL